MWIGLVLKDRSSSNEMYHTFFAEVLVGALMLRRL